MSIVIHDIDLFCGLPSGEQKVLIEICRMKGNDIWCKPLDCDDACKRTGFAPRTFMDWVYRITKKGGLERCGTGMFRIPPSVMERRARKAKDV